MKWRLGGEINRYCLFYSGCFEVQQCFDLFVMYDLFPVNVTHMMGRRVFFFLSILEKTYKWKADIRACAAYDCKERKNSKRTKDKYLHCVSTCILYNKVIVETVQCYLFTTSHVL